MQLNGAERMHVVRRMTRPTPSSLSNDCAANASISSSGVHDACAFLPIRFYAVWHVWASFTAAPGPSSLWPRSSAGPILG